MSESKIGLALSGGGARGFAHIGVLKALVENSIPIDCVAGASAGAFVGAAYASGMSIDEIVELAAKVSWRRMAGFPRSPRGLLSNAPMGRFIESNFPICRIESLATSFAAVACDFATGDEVLLKDSGDLANAVRASCAIPGLFVPIRDESGRLLVDGGVISPTPTRAVKRLGADVIIAIDLLSCGSSYWGVPSTVIGMFFQSAMLMLRTAAKNQHYRAEVVVEPSIAHVRPDDLRRRDELIALGEAAALDRMDEIKAAIDRARSDAAYRRNLEYR